MKRLFLVLFALSLLLTWLPQAPAQATDWQQIPIPPLHPFHPQQPKRVELPNGMVIFLQEDHELPLINGSARIHGGSRDEPGEKVGLVSVLGESWRTGGTKTKTGDQLDDFLEARAAKVETADDEDSTSVSFSCLKGDFDDVFQVFTDLTRAPEFREDKIDLAKKQLYAQIARRNDEVMDIAWRESTRLGYGPQNPYSRIPEYATVAAVSRQDLLSWHHDHVHPNNIIFGVVGDFDSAAMEAKLRQAFGSWAKGPAAKEKKIDFKPPKPGYYLVAKEDVTQTNIHFVDLGTRRDNPDYYALAVFNEAFGGGFSSRLFSGIRTQRGLAYFVGGGVGAGFDHPGLVRFFLGTKSKTTVEAVQAMFEEMDGLAKNPISDQELKKAKDAILNSFVFRLDSPAKVMRERMTYEFYAYPPDYLERYRAGIEKVTKDDVARVAAKYLHKEKLAVLVVGNTAEFDKPLSALGPVTNVDITIPPMPEEKGAGQPAKPAASRPEGK